MNKSKPIISAAVFDLDGTLLDTLKDLADCFNRVLASLGYATHPQASYRAFIGDGARKCIERALPESERDRQTIDHCLALQQQDYRNNWAVATQPYPGMDTLLEALSTLNIQLAVLSNKDQYFTELCVNHFFRTTGFKVIQGAQPGIANKPDPAGCFSIAEKMQLDVDRFILVGDSAVDMQAARGSGMLGIGAGWGFRGRKELVDAGAFAIIDSPLQLLDFLDQ